MRTHGLISALARHVPGLATRVNDDRVPGGWYYRVDPVAMDAELARRNPKPRLPGGLLPAGEAGHAGS